MLTFLKLCCIIIFVLAAMAQSVERILGKDEVAGSIPASSSKKKRFLLGSVSFCVCIRRTQHRLRVYSQHHFSQSENIVPLWRTQNEVAFGKQCCASHKRCGFANDVAIRANIWYNLNEVTNY